MIFKTLNQLNAILGRMSLTGKLWKLNLKHLFPLLIDFLIQLTFMVTVSLTRHQKFKNK